MENVQNFDIFSPKGKFLYQAKITLPEGHRIRANGVQIKGDFIYIVVENEDGDLSLRKYSCDLPALK
jgi:hypothetical protein